MTHTDFEQLAAGYVLGALEPADENAFERHLEGCESCEATVRELEAVVGKLAYSASPVEPPPSLRAAIRREVAATARPRGGRAATPAGAARELQRIRRRRWTTTLVGRLAVAAGIVALLVLGLWNLGLSDRIDRDQQRVAALEQAARLLNDDAVQTVRLQGSAGRATALVSSLRDRGVLVVEDLPPCASAGSTRSGASPRAPAWTGRSPPACSAPRAGSRWCRSSFPSSRAWASA
jgi:anti-sigma factor RsiW